MRKQLGLLLPNKALSVESFLHWIKLGTEIRRRQRKTALGINTSFPVQKSAASVVERTSSFGGDTLPPCARKAHQQPEQRLPLQIRCGLRLALTLLPLKFSCALTFVQRLLLFPEALAENAARFPIFTPPRCLALQPAAQSAEPAARRSLQGQRPPNRLHFENTTEQVKAPKVEKALSDICFPLTGLFGY